MKIILPRAGFILLGLLCCLAAPRAHAGISLQLDVVHQNPGDGYTCNVIVFENDDTPDTTPITYHEIISPTAKFCGGDGAGASNFSLTFNGDFNGMMNEITNGTWQLVMNTGTPGEHSYSFTVANVGLTSNFVGSAVVDYPPNGSNILSALPDFEWQGPANAGGLTVTLFNTDDPGIARGSGFINPGRTSITLPPQVTPGPYSFTVDYIFNIFSKLVPGTPMDSSNNPAPGWEYKSTADSFGTSLFTVLPPQQYTLPESLDATNVTWTTTTNAPWFPETTNTADGISAAQSGVIDVNQSSILQTTVTGPAYITFNWQTVDDDGDFNLAFNIDGTNMDELNGDFSWFPDGPFTVGPGQHNLQWIAFANNTGSDSPTNDSGYVGIVTIAPLPTLQFTADVLTGQEPLTVQFMSPNVDSAGNPVTNWAWNFGDGGTSILQSPSHIYNNLGNFLPTLVARSQNVSVPLLVTGVGSIAVINPVVNYTATPISGPGPLSVKFTTPATDTGGHTVTNWSWRFGDGATSAAQNPSHVYTNRGLYLPSLTAKSTGISFPENGVGPAAISVTKSPAMVLSNLTGRLTAFTFNNFANPRGLEMNGNATNVTTSDGPVLELTKSATGQAGSAFIAAPIPFGPSMGFSTFFMFRLSKPGGIGAADGITFTLQSNGPFSIGSGGGGLGYGNNLGTPGISNSLSVEFDTFDNGGEINGNHVAINFNAGINDPVAAVVTNGFIGDGNIWYAWIDYEGVSGDFEVRVSNTPVRPRHPTLDAAVNLPGILGDTEAYAGFTGGTGSGWEQQDILAWKFTTLPSSRITGAFVLTNAPPGFQINAAVMLFGFTYNINGVNFTNYTYAPVALSNSINGQIAYSSKLGDFSPNAFDNLINGVLNGISATVNSNAAALDALDAGLNQFTMLAAYTSSASPGGGIMLNSRVTEGIPSVLQGANYDTIFAGYHENDFVTSLNDAGVNLPPGPYPTDPPVTSPQSGSPNPPGNIPDTLGASLDATLAAITALNSAILIPPDSDGNFSYDSTSFSTGTDIGTMTARQQLVSGPPLPAFLLSPRIVGENLLFDFVTVSNLSYTVWTSANLATTNWTPYTNVIGDGYVQKVTVPLTNTTKNFFRLSSP